VPVQVTLKAPRSVTESASAADLLMIVGQAIIDKHNIAVQLNEHGDYIDCTTGPYWDHLPPEEMEVISSERGSWGE
jgi:hypothetical protein